MTRDATLEKVRPVLDRPRSKELVLRILSGIVLAAVALTLAHAGPKAFAALVAAVALLMSWEWARIVRGVRYDAAFGVHAAAVVGAVAVTVAGFPALALTTIAVGAAVIVPLQFGARAFASATSRTPASRPDSTVGTVMAERAPMNRKSGAASANVGSCS